MSKSNKNILFIMTGSIACYKACGIISSLHQKGYKVKTVLSPNSVQFIGAATIEGLTNEAPITDMYQSGNVMDHIHLDRWADLILVAPATANYINKIAHGLGDDLLTTLFLAHDFKKPFLIAPAMNTMMYQHPTTQQSLTKLKSFGIQVLEAASGVLACGEVGYGKLLDPTLIVQEIEDRLGKGSEFSDTSMMPVLVKRKVLITAGGTSEPIDDIRVITNISTGKTAASIADRLIESGIEVEYLHAATSKLPVNPCSQTVFTTFDDLDNTLSQKLRQNSYDAILHLAAVSDYSVVKQNAKISSDAEQVTLTLIKNKKLINQMKVLNPKTKLFGFKLTSTTDRNVVFDKVKKLFTHANCDFVVHNDWNDINKNSHTFQIFNPDMKAESAANTHELSYKLYATITENL